MKISAIQQFRNKVNYNNSNQPAPVMSMPQNAGMSYADGIQNSGNYGKAQVMMKNNPSFGSVTLGGVLLYYLILAAAFGGINLALILSDKYQTKVAEKARKLEEARIKAQFEQDVVKLANTLDMSPKKAQKYHEKYIGASFIPQKGKAMEERGLNAVRGYSMEKYELMKDVLSPVVIAQKAAEKNRFTFSVKDEDKIALKAARENVPNNILFYGPRGTGKTYLARKIGEHAEQFGSRFVELDFQKVSEQEYEDYIKNTLKNAEEHFNNTGMYTFVLLNDRPRSLSKAHALHDTFLNSIENSKEKGIIFVATINNPTEIDPAFLRQGRFEKIMHIGKMEKFEVADMINYALQRNYVPKENLERFDIQKVVDKIEEENWNFTPDEYLSFVKNLNSQRILCTDEMIDAMDKYVNPEKNKKNGKVAYNIHVFAEKNLPKYQKEVDYVKQIREEQQGAEDESIV